MPVRRAITDTSGIYFISTTCARWKNLFEITNGYDIVYKWFDYLKRKAHYICGYVIMPNHFHALIAFRNSDKPINKIIGDGKRFMSYDIVIRLSQLGQEKVLSDLKSLVNNTDRKRGKLHEVFEPSFDWKACESITFIQQKLDYMHNNPCQKSWTLADNPADYLHSSASFYILGQPGHYPVTSFGELEDIDLTK